jgi:hypothetical protein
VRYGSLRDQAGVAVPCPYSDRFVQF